MRRIWVMAALAAGLGLATTAAAAPAAERASEPRAAAPLLVRTGPSLAGGREVKSLGPMRDRRWRLSSFRAAFGPPTTCTAPRPDIAVAEWRSVGVKANFYTLGLEADGCVGRHLFAGVVTLRGPRWQTQPGLRIGDATSRVVALYPDTVRRGTQWWLERVLSSFGASGEFPTLVATSRAGIVRSFVASIGAGGE